MAGGTDRSLLASSIRWCLDTAGTVVVALRRWLGRNGAVAVGTATVGNRSTRVRGTHGMFVVVANVWPRERCCGTGSVLANGKDRSGQQAWIGSYRSGGLDMLILARHGRTQANASHLLQGRSDNRLDALGERQAAEIATVLAQLDGGLDRIISSPLPRAMQTAAASAELLGAEVTIDERWSELDYGEWEALPISEISAEAWRHWRSDASFAPPGGESLAALNIRVAHACEAVVAAASEINIAVFTHVSPIKAAVRWVLDVDDEISWHLHVAQAQITKIEVRGERVTLSAFNDVSHLSGA